MRKDNTALSVGQNVAVIGSGSGIPFKIESGGAVRDGRAASLDYFQTNSDAFAGNSGSGVYETDQHRVAGILVRGTEPDYVANGTCNVVNVCPQTGCGSEEVTYVYPALQAVCAELGNSSTRLCAGLPPPPVRPPNSFGFGTSNTSDATRNTVDRLFALATGDVLAVSVCNLPDFPSWGSPKLRLVDAQGVEVATSHDGCGFKFRSGASGNYTLRAGCYADASCGGTAAWTVTLNANLVRGSYAFNVTNTSSGSRNTANQNVTLSLGQVLIAGTCGVENASGTGDTILRLHDATGNVAAENDDAFGDCGSLSRIHHEVHAVGTNMPYQLRVGCFRNGACSGTVSYVIY